MTNAVHIETRARARIAILAHIAQFSLARMIGSHVYGPSDEFCFRETREPAVGALVALNSAPMTKWYLSWVHAVAPGANSFCTRYTLESIEDGQLCDWSNISLLQYDQRSIIRHPEWRWTDRQWEFRDRWERTLKQKRNAYIYLGCWPTFQGDTVELQVRVRHGFNETLPGRSFPDWRKVTKRLMLEFYDEQVAAYKAIDHALKAFAKP